MTANTAPTFVVTRTHDGHPFVDFVYEHPETGLFVPGAELGRQAGYLATKRFSQPDAVSQARRLNAGLEDKPWRVELAPEPCPNCGRQMESGDMDFIYPQTRLAQQWRAGCNRHDFGCGFELQMDAQSAEEMTKFWNEAEIYAYPGPNFVTIERKNPLELKQLLVQELPEAQRAEEDLQQWAPSPELKSLALTLSEDPSHSLHFVAKHYLLLMEILA